MHWISYLSVYHWQVLLLLGHNVLQCALLGGKESNIAAMQPHLPGLQLTGHICVIALHDYVHSFT